MTWWRRGRASCSPAARNSPARREPRATERTAPAASRERARAARAESGTSRAGAMSEDMHRRIIHFLSPNPTAGGRSHHQRPRQARCCQTRAAGPPHTNQATTNSIDKEPKQALFSSNPGSPGRAGWGKIRTTLKKFTASRHYFEHKSMKESSYPCVLGYWHISCNREGWGERDRKNFGFCPGNQHVGSGYER